MVIKKIEYSFFHFFYEFNVFVVFFSMLYFCQMSFAGTTFRDLPTEERLRSFLEQVSILEKQRSFHVKEWVKTRESEHSHIFEGRLQVNHQDAFYKNFEQQPSIPFRFYLSLVNPEKKKPVLVLFPPIEGTLPFEQHLGKFLAYMGIHVLVSYPQESLVAPHLTLHDLNALISRTAIIPSYLLDWLESRTEVDRQAIGFLGISMGGIRAALAMGIDSRPKAGILIVAGGNLPEILTYSQQDNAVIFREHVMRREGLSNSQDLLNYFKKGLLWDPLSFAEDHDHERFLMFASSNDKVVPSKNQRDLWIALGRPKVYELSFGHVGSALASVTYFKTFYRFLWDRWFPGWKKSQRGGESVQDIEERMNHYFLKNPLIF
jgi:hypothetical protein